MTRSRLLPLLATLLVAGSRADGQPGLPPPATHPDPAAVLLPPVGLQPADTGPVPPEPAARLRPAVETVAAFKPEVGTDLPRDDGDRHGSPATRKNWDAYDYLTAKDSARPADSPRLSRAPGDDDLFPPSVFPGDKGGGFLDRLREPGKREKGLFCTDRDFDNFITPMTNPFLFESAQTSTEVRGLFLGQGIPNPAGPFNGGTAYFAGGQARLAFGERFSVTVNKIGLTSFQPGSGSAVGSATGLAELWLGPKFVAYRNKESQTLVTVGAIFQIPLGSSSAYQNTGKLSIAPYVSVAQRLFEYGDWGTLNAQANAGYSFATNRDRSDYFYANGHLSWNWRNRGRFFPLVELNWFQYTANGQSSGFGVEGRDLANIGAAVGRSGLFTGAVGARYRFGERWETGAAFELPFAGNKDLFRYRFTLDLIWRY